MREILSIQIGGCGNNIGRRFWQELCKEHSLDESSGHRRSDYKEQSGVVESMDSFFDQDRNGGYLPRAILADLDSGAIDSIFSGCNGRLFREEYAISGHCGSGGNFAKGQNEGRLIYEMIADTVRKSIESCDSFQGFQIFHSTAGGTGSGLSSVIVNSLRMEFPDKMFSSISVMPTINLTEGVLEAYNSVLHMHDLVENVDYVKIYDNEALYNICKKIGMEKAGLEDLNGIIAKSVCGENCSFRFNGLSNNDMRKLATNMIPFPRIHFFVSSMAPLAQVVKGQDCTDISLHDISRQLFSPSHFLASIKPHAGRYYTCSGTFRGDFATTSAEDEMFKTLIYQSSYFMEWVPNNIQTSHCKVAGPGIKRSGTLLASTSSVSDYLRQISDEFTKLFRKKAFLNWYTSEGMDEMEFTEAESNVNDLISEYIPWGAYIDYDEEEDYPQPDEQSN